MKFITKEHFQRFDYLASIWQNPRLQKPVSALALAEKELLKQTADADAVTKFSMKRLAEPFEADELCERRLIEFRKTNGAITFHLENGALTLVNPEFVESEKPAKAAARTVLKAIEVHTLANRFQVHLLFGDYGIAGDITGGVTGEIASDVTGVNGTWELNNSEYLYCTANCDSLRFDGKAA